MIGNSFDEILHGVTGEICNSYRVKVLWLGKWISNTSFRLNLWLDLGLTQPFMSYEMA